jgi:hypothetical protein
MAHLRTVREALDGSRTRLFYTLEVSDRVERWTARTQAIYEQMHALDPLTDGRLVVWGNELLASLRPGSEPRQEHEAGAAVATPTPARRSGTSPRPAGPP